MVRAEIAEVLRCFQRDADVLQDQPFRTQRQPYIARSVSRFPPPALGRRKQRQRTTGLRSVVSAHLDRGDRDLALALLELPPISKPGAADGGVTYTWIHIATRHLQRRTCQPLRLSQQQVVKPYGC